MYGAIYGDILGLYYEVHCTKDFNFEFHKDSCFTDDTVMTVALCNAIIRNPGNITCWHIRKSALEYAGQLKQYYSFYPDAGFGNMFAEWAREKRII